VITASVSRVTCNARCVKLDTIQIGPVGLPTLALATLLGLLLFHYLACKLAKSEPQKKAAERVVWWSVLSGFVVARLHFTIAMWPVMQAAPWQIVNISDGGFIPESGLIAGMLVAVMLLNAHNSAFRPVLTAAAVSLLFIASSHLVVKLNAKAPDLTALTIYDDKGNSHSLPTLTNGPAVVNVWATWCPPCRKEMPVFSKVQQSSSVPVLLINQGESVSSVATFTDSLGVPMQNIYFDHGHQLSQALGASVLPATFFINSEGKIVSRHYGAMTEASLTHYLKAIE